jgi:dTDP-glucose 4,6-dehydratase
MSKRTILITGAAGFVASHVIEHFLKNTDDTIIGCDSLTYAGTWDRLRDISIDGESAFEHPRFKPLQYDFRLPAEPNMIKDLQSVTHVLHLGAESHVDLSIVDPMRFVQANVVGTVNVLEIARKLINLKLFVQFSTDEVFGSTSLYSTVGFKESSRHNPKNPYAATKSAAEQMVNAFANTYKIPSIVTNGMNIFGERQHSEKFIPLCIRKALNGEKISIHATADKTKAGRRTYIHGRNVAAAILFLLDCDLQDNMLTIKLENEVERFNIVGEKEVDNLALAKMINELVLELAPLKGFKPVGATFEMVDFHSSRPGHDLRYALDGSRLQSFGWVPPKTFEDSLRKTVQWSLENPKWVV